MAFNPGSYTKHQDYQLMVSRFKGVDSTDPAFSLDNARGTYSNNYAYIGDCVQTRWAKEQTSDLGGRVRGLWHFRAGDGDTHYIAVIGDEVAELSSLNAKAVKTRIYTLENGEGKCFAVVGDKRLWLLTGEKYLMAYHNGLKIVCEEVAESDYCYVPTTMTAIVATDALTTFTNAGGEAETMTTRVELDKPNMLSRWRKNKILTGVQRSGSAMPNFVLDGLYSAKDDFDELNVSLHAEYDDFGALSINEDAVSPVYDEDVKNELNSKAMTSEGSAVYVTDGVNRITKFTTRRYVSISNRSLSYKPLFVDIEFDGVVFMTLPFDTFIAYAKSNRMGMNLSVTESGFTINYFNENLVRVKDAIITVEGNSAMPTDFHGQMWDSDIHLKDGTVILKANPSRIYLVEKFFSFVGSVSAQTTDVGVAVTDRNGKMMIGYIENVEGSSVLTLFVDPKPAIGGESNVTLTYPVYNASLANEIDGCRIGCRFGHNNSLNRLWVSGNESLPHYVIHSEVGADRPNEGDYSYFPLDGELRFGNEENAVLGLDVIDSNRMIVLKGKSGNERTIYFVSPSNEAKVSSDGATTYSVETYQITMSNSPVAILGLGQVVNFYGATLFIGSDNKVNMLTESGAIGNTARQASSVSHFIDHELSTQDLKEAVLFSFDKYLILNAETRSYISNRDSAANGQFEWWPCDKFEGATAFLCDVDGTVFYGTEDGKLVKLTLGSDYREDSSVFFSEEGDDNVSSMSVPQYTEEGGIVSPHVQDGDLFQPNADNEPYISLGEIGSTVVIRPNLILFREAPTYPLHDGIKVYLNDSETYVRVLRECEDPVEYNGKTYWFAYATDGAPHGQVGGDVLIKMEDEYEIKGMRFFYQGKRLDVRTIGGTKTRLYGSFTRKTPVMPEFVTKPLLCETLNYAKTITQAELWNDTRMPSELHAKMVGNKVWSLEADKSVQDSRSQFSFDSPNFEDCGFDKKVVPTHYSLRRFPKSQAFFTIMLKGNSKRVSVLSGVKLTYQKRGMAKGRG